MTRCLVSPGSRLVVTGASGYIGRALCQRIVGAGRPLLALSRRGTAFPGAANVRIAAYRQAVVHPLLEPGDVVVHLVGQAHDPQASEASLQEGNVDSVTEVALAASRVEGIRFLLLSSIGVLGAATSGRPFQADDAPAPWASYAHSKLAGEQALRTVAEANGLPWMILRPPLVYGPACPGNFTRLLGLIQRLPVLPFGSLTGRRSFIYVGNLVDAVLRAAACPILDRKVLLVRDGEDLSMADLVHRLVRLLGRSPRCVLPCPPSWLRGAARLAGRREDAERLFSELQVDDSLFRGLTGWRAPFSVDEGLAWTVAAFRADPQGR